MLDRPQVDAVIYRVAVAGFTYYPDKRITEPGYTIDEDLDWCMRPLRHLLQEDREDQYVAPSRLVRVLARRRTDRSGPRLTENTLIRIAIRPTAQPCQTGSHK